MRDVLVSERFWRGQGAPLFAPSTAPARDVVALVLCLVDALSSLDALLIVRHTGSGFDRAIEKRI
jgi:hypothetical protein